MARFIVTGTGRSGTTYSQAIFRICGLNVTHQQVFTWETIKTKRWSWMARHGDSSYMAVPILPDIRRKEPDTLVILMKRDPKLVAESWLRRGAFTNHMDRAAPDLKRVLNQHFPDVLKSRDPMRRALNYVDTWNGYAEQYADHIYNIENVDPRELFEVTGHMDMYDSVLVNAVSHTINSDTR